MMKGIMKLLGLGMPALHVQSLVNSQFHKGPSPRGGWTIQPHSRSKYSPRYGVNAAARNASKM